MDNPHCFDLWGCEMLQLDWVHNLATRVLSTAADAFGLAKSNFITQTRSSFPRRGIEVTTYPAVMESGPWERKGHERTTRPESVPKTTTPSSWSCLEVLMWTRKVSMRSSISARPRKLVGLKYCLEAPRRNVR